LLRYLTEVKQASIKKTTIFWDITPCSPLRVNRRFGGTYRLHILGRKMSSVRNHHESRSLPPAFTLVSCGIFFFDPEYWGDMFLLNVDWHSTDYRALYLRRLYSSQPRLWEPQILQIKNYLISLKITS
jgi:hypothetical protein